MQIYGVIMAGGGGSRFWPLSRKKTPKQLLNLTGNELMINETVDRLLPVTNRENLFIVTNKEQYAAMLEAAAGRVEAAHILSEPSARNTAACIGYAATEIMKKYGDGVMIIVPADHYIGNTAAFARALQQAVTAAEQSDKLVTVGITPTFPATGFGYIRFDAAAEQEAKPVSAFREKPNAEKAQEYLAAGCYLWNSGMFIWKASTILEKYRIYIPDIYDDLTKIGHAMGTDAEKRIIEEVYPRMRKVSVDYAVMEPSASRGEVLVVPGQFDWNDVGSWDMLNVFHAQDANGNILVGDALGVDVSNSVIYAGKRLVAAVGVDNIIVVETPDAVMVCSKERAQDVKKLVNTLQAQRRTEYL